MNFSARIKSIVIWFHYLEFVIFDYVGYVLSIRISWHNLLNSLLFWIFCKNVHSNLVIEFEEFNIKQHYPNSVGVFWPT